ncbi:MAG: alanine--tRNA ligase, partial [Chloroflexota bacterium]
MNSDEIRQKFLEFFLARDHVQLPSLSLVPHSPDITTLFTVAGMQQMIGYFVGRDEPTSRRLVTDQKSIRTVDISEVGDDTHLTFLEMLGNFSVGDYFKRESIAYTWQFLTKVMGVPEDRWWATIYPGDDESRQAWLSAGLPPERICETDENFWSQGAVGPSGRDSEIFFDRGAEFGCGAENCSPCSGCCDRFVEIWNNVFMTDTRDDEGVEHKLPWNNVDTGMGFERLVAVVQGVRSVYETDLFQPIIRRVAAIAGVTYGDSAGDRSLRIISDHSRAAAFMIADGVMPSSEGRGYVLRRLIRRAALHGRLLGIEEPFLSEPVAVVIDLLSGYWKELDERRTDVLAVANREEIRFLHTLSRGLSIFEEIAETATGSGGEITGAEAFSLKDTYGFPLELTQELAEARDLRVDEAGFQQALTEQQTRGREAHARFSHRVDTSADVYTALAKTLEPTEFTGYGELQTMSEISALVAGGKPVERIEAGDEAEIFLTSSPFYAESGGQVGDTGLITADTGEARVTDTYRPAPNVIAHKVEIVSGHVSVGDVVRAEVEAERRLHILPHHSGTHLLHKALQEVLGPEATQAGSLVAPDRLRFDFRWPRPLSAEQTREIQDRINASIWANLPVRTEIKAYGEAIAQGATALFGEKYGDQVRVVSIGDWSQELCGGTHVRSTGDIGLLVITSETGTASG